MTNLLLVLILFSLLGVNFAEWAKSLLLGAVLWIGIALAIMLAIMGLWWVLPVMLAGWLLAHFATRYGAGHQAAPPSFNTDDEVLLPNGARAVDIPPDFLRPRAFAIPSIRRGRGSEPVH